VLHHNEGEQRMELNELTHRQRIALVALVEAIVLWDGQVTEGEERGIGVIAGALGDEEYRRLVEEVDEHFEDIAALKKYLATIEATEARELIYGMALDEALSSPGVDESKSDLLQWLADTWQIKVEMGTDEE
jgi:hypothetical protein